MEITEESVEIGFKDESVFLLAVLRLRLLDVHVHAPNVFAVVGQVLNHCPGQYQSCARHVGSCKGSICLLRLAERLWHGQIPKDLNKAHSTRKLTKASIGGTW